MLDSIKNQFDYTKIGFNVTPHKKECLTRDPFPNGIPSGRDSCYINSEYFFFPNRK